MIQDIEISRLKVHPNNVRKSYNDIDELADSIKAQGILQNLTVVPDPDEEGMFLVVIGNRRLTAARKAGIKTAPCYVTQLDEKEQASMMLLENMQRNDLTIYEQAQGFQMVLDLGETEDGLSEKTGLSKTTIRRRVNIAKLDQDVLNEKENDSSFQLSLTDLYELEKVKDVEARNEILKNARDSRDLAARALAAVTTAKRNEHEKQAVALLEKSGIECAPSGTSNEMYSGKWETIETIDLDKDIPEEITLKPEGKEKFFWLRYYREIKVIRKAKKAKKEKTPAQLEKEEKESRKKKIKEIEKNINASRREFVLNIISGKIKKIKDETEIQKALWDVMRKTVAFISDSGLAGFILGKNTYEVSEEEKQAAMKTVENLSVTEMALISACKSMQDKELANYNGEYVPGVGEISKVFDGVLVQYGYSYSTEEEWKIIDGTHELYTKPESEKDEQE